MGGARVIRADHSREPRQSGVMLQIRVDRVLHRCILVELVLVDNGIRLGDFLFIGTGASLEIRLLVPLLDGVEKVIALATELHSDLLS